MGAMTNFPAVIELRRYRMRPGGRDKLITLFQREFIETQDAVGLQILGIFREPDAPDRFTWLRGFADMPTRAAGLNAFYTGPAWRAHREAANATMEDASDVLLLRPCPRLPAQRPERRSPARPWRAIVLPLIEPPDAALRDWLGGGWLPTLERAGAEDVAVFETEPAPNNFPALPVRTDGPVVVVLAAWPRLEPVPGLTALAPRLRAEPLVLTLEPTTRSSIA
jgi:hypothetical protein